MVCRPVPVFGSLVTSPWNSNLQWHIYGVGILWVQTSPKWMQWWFLCCRSSHSRSIITEWQGSLRSYLPMMRHIVWSQAVDNSLHFMEQRMKKGNAWWTGRKKNDFLSSSGLSCSVWTFEVWIDLPAEEAFRLNSSLKAHCSRNIFWNWNWILIAQLSFQRSLCEFLVKGLMVLKCCCE